MERRHDVQRVHRSAADFTPWCFPSAGVLQKRLGNSWISTKTKHRRSHYCHHGGKSSHRYNGYSWATSDPQGFYLQHQFSEDSGISSCGSSASSIADETDVVSGPFFPTHQTSVWPASTLARKKIVRARYGPQLGTVASVLAAGIASDSEETDHLESDEEVSDNFSRATSSCSKSSSIISSPLPQTQQIFTERVERKDGLQFKHFGRDILDLGSNLQTNFPLRSTVLPERNLPLFLQNRSQYHRLGKFGTSEVLCYATCRKTCGFSFPVPSDGAQGCEHDREICLKTHN